MPYPPRTRVESVSQVTVVHSYSDGYRCEATVRINDERDDFRFAYLVPPSAYGQIESRWGRFGKEQVERLFVARITQWVASGRLMGWPSRVAVDLATLDYRELDGLIAEIDHSRHLY